MKKTLMLAAFGVIVSAVSTFAQSSFVFANYDGGTVGTIGGPITYAATGVPAGSENLALGPNFSAQLYYLNASSVWTALPGAVAAFYGTADGDIANGAGYFYYGAVTIPMPIGDNTIKVYVSNTVTVGSYAPGEIFGESAPFTITTVDPQNPNQPNFGAGYQAFTVSAAPVPEPSTFALAGLGLAGLLIFRRRK